MRRDLVGWSLRDMGFNPPYPPLRKVEPKRSEGVTANGVTASEVMVSFKYIFIYRFFS
jgi:hypothetical protein